MLWLIGVWFWPILPHLSKYHPIDYVLRLKYSTGIFSAFEDLLNQKKRFGYITRELLFFNCF